MTINREIFLEALKKASKEGNKNLYEWLSDIMWKAREE